MIKPWAFQTNQMSNLFVNSNIHNEQIPMNIPKLTSRETTRPPVGSAAPGCSHRPGTQLVLGRVADKYSMGISGT